jgi:hypothetical protein
MGVSAISVQRAVPFETIRKVLSAVYGGLSEKVFQRKVLTPARGV